MRKIDFKKEYGKLYFPTARDVTVVDVPPMNFVMVDGTGDPNTAPAYRQALEALYGVSYTAKFALKFEGVADYKVAPLEGLWWAGNMGRLSAEAKENWKWTSMIMQPDVVTGKHVETALVAARKKKDNPAFAKVRFERFQEGHAAQIMHIGPWSAEGPTIEKVHTFIQSQGYRLRGKHHEIYLGDPRRTAPERLKTVVRQPFSK